MNLKRVNIICAFALALLVAACGKEMPFYEQSTVSVSLEMSYGESASSVQDEVISTGKIRYIIRTFPVGASNRSTPVQEFIVVKDIKDGFDHKETIDLYTGSYDLMVWSDLIEDGQTDSCYDADDFGEISLREEYTGGNEYRNAFRGVTTVDVEVSDEPAVVKVEMERPLARFELVSNDLQQFLNAHASLAERSASLEEYTAVVFYVGYKPNVYNLYTDKPVGSVTGVSFMSPMIRLNDTEAELGFDYVFVGEKSASVTVKVGIYDAAGKLVSVSAPIKVALHRGGNTVKTGSFLTSSSSLDGIYIDKEFDGSFDIEI